MPAGKPREFIMPLVDIQVIKNVFSADQKGQLIQKVTDAMVAVEGEAMRPVTWVRIHEVDEGSWAIGGTRLAAADVHRMANGSK
jgi:4-oxalocrotonate tautomerase